MEGTVKKNIELFDGVHILNMWTLKVTKDKIAAEWPVFISQVVFTVFTLYPPPHPAPPPHTHPCFGTGGLQK